MKLQARSWAHIKVFWMAYAVLLTSLALTFAAYFSHKRYVGTREHLRFEQGARLIFEKVEAQLGIVLSIMKGVRGLYAANDEVTPLELRRYFELLRARDLERDTGLEGIGIIWGVPEQERDAHIATMRQTYPKYSISSPATNGVAYVITHLESPGPDPENALGLDIYADPVRRKALDQARDSGQPAITAKTQLFKAVSPLEPTGFLIYVPIYKKVLASASQAELRENLIGFVFTAFDAAKLWNKLFGDEPRTIDFELYDGPDLSKENLLYDNDGVFHDKLPYTPAFSGNLQGDVFGRTWTFHFYTRPNADSSFERRVPIFILGLGIIGSCLFFGFVYVQAKGRETAETFTQELRASEAAVRNANTELARKVKETEETSEKLAASLSLQLATLESTADGLLVLDCEEKVVSFNQRFLAMWKLPANALSIGNKIEALRPAAEQLPNPSAFLRKLQDGCAASTPDTHEVLALQEGRLIELHSRPQISGSKTLGRVWSFRDVTEQKRAEEDLIRASKVESIGVLAGGIAHDFNNVLTGIVGNLSLLREHPGLPPEVAERLGMLEKSAFKARQLTLQLLTFAKGGSPIKQTTSISEIVREAAEFALRGSNVRAEFNFAQGLAAVEIDTGQISQVIHNLVINSTQAMPGGGVIKITGENCTLDQQSNLPLPKGKYVRVSLQDSGSGIKRENLARIFDPYFTTKEKGTGLGLATAYSILKRHEGLITVESEWGQGAVFHLYLPASRIVERQQAKAKAEPQAALRGSGRILAMDDEAGIRTLLAAVLAHFGYEATTVADGAEAVREYKRAAEANRPYSAVIMDLTVPGGMGGKETIRALKEIDPGVKAIVSSGYCNDPVLADYKKYGFIARVEKPFRMQELGGALSAVLGARKT